MIEGIMETVNLKDIYQKLTEIEKSMATKNELAETIETIFVLSNENTMKQIELSEEDIRGGKFKTINSVRDL